MLWEAFQQLIRLHRSAANLERREEDRVDFIQPVQVVTEDGRELTLLSRDLSATGIRLVGISRLLGQKVRVLIPNPDGAPLAFLARVLWTYPFGDGLVENGGSFLPEAKAPGQRPSVPDGQTGSSPCVYAPAE